MYKGILYKMSGLSRCPQVLTLQSIGLDLTDGSDIFSSSSSEVDRNVVKLIQEYQESFNVIERCRALVTDVVHVTCEVTVLLEYFVML